MHDFTHIDARGNAVMVDIGDKGKTARQAIATGTIKMSPECYSALQHGGVNKGDVLGVARIAGIMAVKKTDSLIPLCHTLHIDHASVDFELIGLENAIDVTCTVRTSGATGVEMEALTGVSIALLTIYDMCKSLDKGMELENIRLIEKSGGKSGDYCATISKRHPPQNCN